MSEQDCAGDSSSKRHRTSFKTWGENHLQQALLPFTSSLLPLPSDPSQDPKTPPGQEEGDHSWLLAPRPPGVSLATPSPPQCSWAAPAAVLPRRCSGIFLAWILCSLLLINPLWATSRTLKCGKLARAKYFLFPCSDLWTGWTAEVMPGEGLNDIPDNSQLLKLACFVQLQPKSSSTLFPLECPALCLSLLICYTSLFYNLPCLLQRQGNSLCHSAFISFCLGNHTGILRKGKTL